jgi:hypothetical protein
LKAYDAQERTNDQRNRITWYENEASNKDPQGLRGELKWNWNKARINQILVELSFHHSKTIVTPLNSDHSVLVIALETKNFDLRYLEVLAKLRSKATVVEVTRIADAIKHLSPPHQYSAVLVTDGGMLNGYFPEAQKRLVPYARAGGTVIFGFNSSSHAIAMCFNPYFSKTWFVNWKKADETRSMFSLNPCANEAFRSRCGPNIPQQYSMKAVHVIGAPPEDRIYISHPDSEQSPVVFTEFGKGNLGWLGDVSTEEETTEVLLTMCGL